VITQILTEPAITVTVPVAGPWNFAATVTLTRTLCSFPYFTVLADSFSAAVVGWLTDPLATQECKKWLLPM
jgi:hypothetical protein